MFESFGRTVYRGRWSVLALGVAFAVVAGYFGLGLFGRMADGGFEDPGAQSTSAARWGERWFGGSSPDVVVLYTHPTFEADDEQYRKDVQAVLRALPAEHVTRTTTYWSTKAKELVSEDRHSTYALVTLRGGQLTKQSGYERIKDRLRRAPAGYTVKVGGPIPLLKDLNTQTGADLQQAEALSMPVLLVLLVLVFGSLVAAGLPLVVGLLSVAGALFLLRLLTEVTDVSVFSLNVVTMLGLGLAIDYSLFVLNAFREEIRRGSPVETAVVRTMATAGRTVAFSGLTVATSLSGLLLFPQMFLRSIGLGAAAVVLVAMVAALVVLPALLAVLGPRVDAIRVAPDFGFARHKGGSGTWHAIASSVMRRPVVYLAGVGVVLIALAAPFAHVRFGSVDHRVLPERFESRQVAEEINTRFARNAMSPIDVIVLIERDLVGPMTVSAPGALTSDVGTRRGPVGVGDSGITPVTEVGPLDVRAFAERLEALDHVTGVDLTGISQNNGAVRLAVRYDKDPMSDEARSLVERIRALPHERNFQDVVVGGPTAAQLDLQASLRSTLPWTALVVCLMTGMLLFAAFGSVLLPIKAILMNVLSLGASFGVIVWAFQDGNLAGPLGFTPTGSIEATITVLILAVVFGLSMDYELFLLSRVRAEWLRTGDNTAAVATGLERTGGVITSAALLLLVVIAAFSTAGITIVKMLGVGMFVAIVVDATLVRALLVPATMRLMGNANWWLPGFLQGFHRRIEIREHDPAEFAATYVTVEREDGPVDRHVANRAMNRHAAYRDVADHRAMNRRIADHRADPPHRLEVPPPLPQITAPEPQPLAPAVPVRVIKTTRDGSDWQWVEQTALDAELLASSSPSASPASPASSSPSASPASPASSSPSASPASPASSSPPAPPISPSSPSRSAPPVPSQPGFPRAEPRPARSRASTPPPRQHRSNPYPLPGLDPEPPSPARPPEREPARARNTRKVIKPNLDGPGWHWAEEDEDPSPPQPLLTVQDAVGPARHAPVHSPIPGRPIPPAAPPAAPRRALPAPPPVIRLRPEPDPSPRSRPDPPTTAPASPAEPALPTRPAPPAEPALRARPAPPTGHATDAGETPLARNAPAVSSHLIDQLEPLIRPDGGPPAPDTRERALPARRKQPPAVQAVPPVASADVAPPVAEAPPAAPVPPMPLMPTGKTGEARESKELRKTGETGEAGEQRQERKSAGGWVAVGNRTTRVVRPKPDGSGWEWSEVQE